MSGIETITPDFIQKSYLAKLILAISVVILLTGAVGFYFYQGLDSELNNQVDREIEASTVLQENAYDNWFSDRLDEVGSLGETISEEGIQFQDNGQISDFLYNQQFEISDQISNLHYVSATSGDVVASSDRNFEGTNFFDSDGPTFDKKAFEQEVQETGQTDRFVLPAQYGSDKMAVAVLLRFPQNDNAVLIGEINTSRDVVGPRIEQSIEGAATGVISEDDNLVIGNKPEISRPNSDDEFIRTETGDNLYAYQQVSSQGSLYVVTETPKSSAFEVRDIVGQNFGLTLVFAFLFLLAVIGTGGWVAIKNLNTLASKAEEMGEGDLDVELETSRKDEIGVLYDEFDKMRGDLKQRISEAEEARNEAESSRKEAEVARAEAEEMSSYLQDRAEEYSEIMRQVGMGDMTRRMTPDGEEESMDTIAEEFNDMIEELEKTTGQLKSYVDEVENAGAEVEQSAETVRDASEQVAESIQKISDDAYGQKERLQVISETMDQVLTELESMATVEGVDLGDALTNLQDIATDINEIAELSEETMAESERVAGAAEEQAAELNEVSEQANDLQRYAEPLRDILGRFETEAEHEFVFSVGPTGGAQSPTSHSPDDE
ncbi:HAMP domain-containing protein [Halovenus rubra]|uniref:HAMP domain-containing protein n=2 Tax=Halovenus rubra TaxID=869890 RepID=A0ABD5X1N9_9EURY|nr:methyl-accepting chemotaxis protein [Halovenus rubra]